MIWHNVHRLRKRNIDAIYERLVKEYQEEQALELIKSTIRHTMWQLAELRKSIDISLKR